MTWVKTHPGWTIVFVALVVVLVWMTLTGAFGGNAS